jgi:hypothetical protein
MGLEGPVVVFVVAAELDFFGAAVVFFVGFEVVAAI